MSITPPLMVPDEEVPVQKRHLVVHANYEIFVLALAALQVLNSALWLLLRDQQEAQVILLLTAGISVFFVADCLYRWRRAPSRRGWLFAFRGWLLWLGSLPLPFFAVLRLLWYRQSIGKLRRSEVDSMVSVIVEKRAQSTLLGAVFAAIVVLEAAAILILGAESKSAQANIQSAGDAVWWTVVTVATVGYGDKYPVTPAGRVIGGFVMVVGVGLFSVLTSFLAQWFVRSRKGNGETSSNGSIASEDAQALLARLDALDARLAEHGVTHEAHAAGIHARLDEIEKRLASGQ